MFRIMSEQEGKKQFGSTFSGSARVYEFFDYNETKVILSSNNDNDLFVTTVNKTGTNTSESFYSMVDAVERAEQLVKILHRLLGTKPGYLSLQRAYERII